MRMKFLRVSVLTDTSLCYELRYPSYSTIVCAHPRSATCHSYYRNVSVRHLISLTRLCFIAFLSMYIVLIDVLIYSAARVFNQLTYLLTYLRF